MSYPPTAEQQAAIDIAATGTRAKTDLDVTNVAFFDADDSAEQEIMG